ncbi:peptidase C1A papain [Ferruginibacter albus]|nr:peptidase C1A papain [Ferruginibacter albus]
MVDDPESKDQSDDNNNQGSNNGGGFSGGGGGGLLAFLPLLLSLFKGKRIFLLILLAGAAYFFFLRGNNSGVVTNIAQKLFSASGYNFSPQQFNKASVYEGLEDDNNKNPLPEAVSLLKYAPKRGNQGQQGSCVAWSSAYAAQTIAIAAATGENPDSIAFSPSYLYNQIRLDNCEGSYVQKAMETMQANGGVPLSEYPYSDHDCDRTPNSTEIKEGKQNSIHGFTRLTDGDNISEISIRAIKEHLAKDAPVVIGMMVGNSFMQSMMGQDLWTPQADDDPSNGGGHAMCVIGYDDRKYGGAFQIMNSWGSEWGNNGIAWVRYSDFKNYVKEAYGVDPLPKLSEVANKPLECTIGLVNNDTKKYIPLKISGSSFFETPDGITKGTRFKIEIKNATPCYIYLFGQETSGESYVLFPYTGKHSPYCGITGYRLFPRAQSLMADSIGNKDLMAIVVSKDSLDYNSLNNAINQSSQSNYAAKVYDALQNVINSSVQFTNTGDGTIYFKAASNDKKVVASIVAIDKQ